MQYWIRKRKTKCFQYFISVVVFVFQQKNRSIIFLADALLLLLLLFYFYCFCISFLAPLKLEKSLRQPKVLLKKIRHSNQNDSETIVPQNDYQNSPRPRRITKANPRFYGEAWINDARLEKDHIIVPNDFEYTERPRRTKKNNLIFYGKDWIND